MQRSGFSEDFSEGSKPEVKFARVKNPVAKCDMASRKNARDSGICLSAVRQISKILIRVSRCSSDSEQSCTEEAAQIKRHSGRPSRIPITFSRRQGSESYSSEDNEYKSEPNKIDSGKDCY